MIAWQRPIRAGAALARHLDPRPARRASHSVYENPEELGYVLRIDPLLDVMPAEEWRALERDALAA